MSTAVQNVIAERERIERVKHMNHLSYFQNIKGCKYVRYDGHCHDYLDLSTTKILPIRESKYIGKKWMFDGVYALQAERTSWGREFIFALLMTPELYGYIICKWDKDKLNEQ
jgi:hypothetical protein